MLYSKTHPNMHAHTYTIASKLNWFTNWGLFKQTNQIPFQNHKQNVSWSNNQRECRREKMNMGGGGVEGSLCVGIIRRALAFCIAFNWSLACTIFLMIIIIFKRHRKWKCLNKLRKLKLPIDMHISNCLSIFVDCFAIYLHWNASIRKYRQL